jgi:hypothetical protein
VKRRTERLTCCCGGSELEARTRTRAREDAGTRRRGLPANDERGTSRAVAGWRGWEWWSGSSRARSGMAPWSCAKWIGDLVVAAAAGARRLDSCGTGLWRVWTLGLPRALDDFRSLGPLGRHLNGLKFSTSVGKGLGVFGPDVFFEKVFGPAYPSFFSPIYGPSISFPAAVTPEVPHASSPRMAGANQQNGAEWE